jgi:hypothetical protein
MVGRHPLNGGAVFWGIKPDETAGRLRKDATLPTNRELANTERPTQLYPDQAKALGARDRLRASVDGELYENILDMRLYRLRCDTKFPSDLLV